MRLGKKKKSPKVYFFRLTADGVLQYFKKENDVNAKGWLQLTGTMVAHVIDQKTSKETLLGI